MSPNGRRAWRKWCKSRRLKMNAHHRALYTGAKMRKKQPERTPLPPKQFTSRSLIGMTMGARKRAAWYEALRSGYDGRISNRKLRLCLRSVLTADVLAVTVPIEWRLEVRAKYRIGERLRPCPGCANCDPYMGSYGSFYCGDPRNFTPDEECSTEEERELHRQHCEAWAKGERPTVKVSGIEWTEAINYTGRDGKPKTCPAGYAFVERAAYGLGSTRATNDKDGRFCDGSGVLPARKQK